MRPRWTRPGRMAQRLRTTILGSHASERRDALGQLGPAIHADAPLCQVLPASDHRQSVLRGEPRMITAKKQVIVTCINCQSPIKLGFQPIGGQILICVACGADLKVINDQPLELALYSKDWDDDDEQC